MEWLDTAVKLGLSGTSTMLGGAVWMLWKKLEAKEAKHEAQLAAKDSKIEALNERLVNTLIAISERSDDG